MYIESVPSRGARPTILLREGHREGRRVVKRTLANLTHWPADKVDRLRRVLRDEPLVPAEQTGRVLSSLPHGHVEAALAVAHRIGLPEILGSRRSPSRDRVLALVVQRVLKPASKLATAELLGTSTLAEELGMTDISEDDLYATMDWLGKRQTWIEKNLAARHLRNGDSALYDASSSYYEGRTCTLMRFGYSRDGKRGRPIVVYGLMTDAAGRPLSIQAYPGDTGDAATVSDQVDKLRGRFGLDQVVLVGDRGMLTQTCIERGRQHPGIGWISALRSDGLRRLVEDRSLQPSLFDERRLAEIASPSFPGERLVVCCNPLLAERRRTQRQRLLKATEEAFQRIVRELERRTRRPLTAVEIARKVGRVENRFKVGKYLRTEIDDGVFRFVRHPDTIQRDAELDGLYAVRTSEPAERLPALEVVRRYHSLSRVERAFRSMKSVELQVRPIHHRLERRVRTHLFLCMLSYYLEWHLRHAFASLLYEDEASNVSAGDHPLDPASPSPSAKAKKRSRRNLQEERTPQSMPTLLAHLATRCRVRCMLGPQRDAVPVTHLTEPTALQKRTLELAQNYVPE